MASDERDFDDIWKGYLRPLFLVLVFIWFILNTFFKEIADGMGLCNFIKMLTVCGTIRRLFSMLC